MITSQGRVRIEEFPNQLGWSSTETQEPSVWGPQTSTAICSQPFLASLHCPAEFVARHKHPSWHS